MTENTLVHPQYVAGTWKLDPTHSKVAFSVKHLMISKVRGTFDVVDATVVTAENPADTTVEATIDVSSVNTNQADRDNHLRTNDFFKVDEFPTMTFRSTSYEVDGDDVTIEGELTLRGVTKPVTLKGEFGGVIVDGYGQTKAALEATTVINRMDFGVNWNAALEAGGFTLGEKVTVELDLQFTLQA
ncbi:YceI family protein [Paramicrobacterium humi]|nr:YceI family protein [Microbacterium humi]